MTDIEVVDAEIEEEMQNLPAVRASEAIVARGELTVAEIVEQKDKIKQVMDAVMTQGVHYGLIPGVRNPSLFKPGAEAINVALRLAPHYDSEKIWHEDGHLTVVAKCTLKHIPTDLTIATGEGLCTTKENRYAYRQGERLCPACGEPAIIKGKAEYGGGWVCFKKKGGCGAKFDDDDTAITSQEVGKIANPDIADLYNTVLKMADKRALIAAVLNGTAASDVFTQDVEDQPSSGAGFPQDAGSTQPSAGPAPEVRRENDTLPVPTSWAKVTEMVTAYDEETYVIFNEFADAAFRRLFPEKSTTKDLVKHEKDELFKVTAKAAYTLRENVEPQEFPPPTVEDVRTAWAMALEGEELAIPRDGDE
jgi:hypothetical protein